MCVRKTSESGCLVVLSTRQCRLLLNKYGLRVSLLGNSWIGTHTHTHSVIVYICSPTNSMTTCRPSSVLLLIYAFSPLCLFLFPYNICRFLFLSLFFSLCLFFLSYNSMALLLTTLLLLLLLLLTWNYRMRSRLVSISRFDPRPFTGQILLLLFLQCQGREGWWGF